MNERLAKKSALKRPMMLEAGGGGRADLGVGFRDFSGGV
jgi:hypothetical protein